MKAIMQNIRYMMARLGGSVITYTESDRRVLLSKIRGVPISAAPNSCIGGGDIPVVVPETSRRDVVFIGRLISAKKVALLVSAWSIASRSLPDCSRLVIVGSGPELATLQHQVDAAGLSHRVVFTGHIAEQSKLAPIFNSSVVSVSPGYVGLAAIHSLANGVPMLVGDRDEHSPEIEACIPGVTAEIFRSGDAADLSRRIVEFYLRKEYWETRRRDILNFIRDSYSVDAMVDRIVSAAGSRIERVFYKPNIV